MNPKNFYKYTLTDRFGSVDVVPLNEWNLQIEFEKQKDFKNFFIEKMKSKIVFVGEIYERLKQLEGSEFLFDVINLRVWKLCNGIEKTVYNGEIYLTSGEWNKDRCMVTLEFEEQKPDKCIENNKKEKLNLLSEITTKIEVNVNTLGGGEYEYKTCDYVGSPTGVTLISSEYGNVAWCGLGNPYLQNWRVFKHTHQKSELITDNNGNPLYVHKTTWIREIVTINCNEPIQSDWVLIQNNCNTTNLVKYAKKAFLVNENFVHNYTSANEFLYSFTSNIFAGVNSGIGKIDNGMKLNDVIVKFINKFCPSMVVVSDFFQINPENPSPLNYVTNEISLVENLILFQKSDVKRPTSTGNATKAEWTFEKLIETLNKLFFVKYEIYDNVFRLEHLSWFGRNQGLDLTLPKYAKWVKAKNKYTYDFESIPRKEIFGFKEFSSQQWNAEIVYTGDMARGKIDEENIVIEDLTTDVQLCFDNPSSDSNVVNDKGFVLVATRKSGNNYHIITESLDIIRINNSLSYPQLIKRYGLNERYSDTGKLNDSPIIFKSVKPIKKGEELIIPYCCDDVFKPNDIIKTELGDGIVESATLKLNDNTLRLKLAYDVFTSMIPLIDFEGGTFVCEKNGFIVIPLFATVSNGSNGSIVGYTVLPSFNMTNSLLTSNSMKVKPDFGFVGTDTISVIANSNIPNVSKQATFIIHVVDSISGIVAHDDNYNVFHGVAFMPTSILSNDASLDGIMTIVNPDVFSDAGASVNIAPDGTFLYTPPTMFIGTDFFEYTIEDGNGNQSTATVYLHVTFANIPVGVDDYFQTAKNSTLITNGSVGLQRVTDNDYTPDGQVYTYNTIADQFMTINGGNVIIHNNGLFEYSAPTNFVGQDNFDYTVITSVGTGTASVFIQVLPDIYVSFEKVDEYDEIVQQNCNGTMVGDVIKKCKFIAYFWSDINGTIPINVTGLNMRLKYMKETTIGAVVSEEDKMTDIMSGTSDYIVVDFIYEKKVNICKPFLGNEIATIYLYEHGYNLI